MNVPPRLLATRSSKGMTDTLEVLCLEWGIDQRFRLYTTTDEDLSESVWEIDPVEFDTPDDAKLTTYFIESFWLTEISTRELRTGCQLYVNGVTQSPATSRYRDSITALGSLGVLLIEALNRAQTIDPADPEAPEAPRRMERRLRNLVGLPKLSDVVRDGINECLAVCRATARAALQQRP